MNQQFPIDISSRKENITSSEAEILYLMSQGKSSKEIGACLHISPQTVQRHTKNIYRKLEVHNKIEALNKTRWLIAALFGSRN